MVKKKRSSFEENIMSSVLGRVESESRCLRDILELGDKVRAGGIDWRVRSVEGIDEAELV